MRTHRDLVLEIQNSLRDFSIDFKTQVSAKAYEWLECIDQSIDHDLEEIDRQAEKTDVLAGRTIGLWGNDIFCKMPVIEGADLAGLKRQQVRPFVSRRGDEDGTGGI